MTGAPPDDSPAEQPWAQRDEGPTTLSGPPDSPGPPGSATFSLDNRPTPALYLAAWLLSGVGVAILFISGLTDAPARGLLLLGGLVLLVIGLAAAAGYQLVARRTRPAHAYRGPSPLIVFGIWFGVVNIASLGLLIAGVEGLDEAGPFLAGVGLQTVIYIAVVWLFVVRGGALDWRAMGVPTRGQWSRAAGDAAFAAGVMVPVTLLALIGGGIVAQLLDTQPTQVVPTPEDLPGIIAVMIGAAILAPIGEEVFFRGFALTAWLRDLGPRAALVRSSVFFAVIHIANIQTTTFEEGLRQAAVILAVILPLGFVLGWLYLRRGLVAPVVAHITYNGILVVLLIVATQLAPMVNR